MASLSNVYGGRLDEIRLEAEENGWDLVIESDHGTFRFHAHGLASSGDLDKQLLASLRTLLDWNREGEQAAREHAADLASMSVDDFHDRLVGDV